jgi:hypothetical protein
MGGHEGITKIAEITKSGNVRKGRARLQWITGVLLWSLMLQSVFADEPSGVICVAPIPHPNNGRHGTGDTSAWCASGKYSFKIDAQPAVSWPEKESAKIGGLSISDQHRVVVLCSSKRVQSFTFHFSDYKKQKLCLFFNDLYWTVQLWDDKSSPWCRCK